MLIIGLKISRFIIMNNPQQLTFPWSKPSRASFNHFFMEDINSGVKDALLKLDDLFLYGIHETGKSFLLQSICNYYASNKKSALYIPIKEVKVYGTNFLDSLENLDLICIDDIDLIAGDNEWEIAIFNLINSCLISECRLIFASHLNPSTINFNLIDLISRIKKVDHIEIFPVSSNKIPEAIKFVADLRSINLGDKEIKYLTTHSKRNMSDLVNIINKLDNLSLQLKRKITIPLIKQLI